MTEIITRFAPSPTGKLHLGGARTALFCCLFAKKNGGKFLLRIEDTDKERSKTEYTDTILATLKWLNLHWDDEPIYQSQRLDKYQAIASQLLDQGKAYRCTCTAEELETMREEQMKHGNKNPKYDGRHREANLGTDSKNYVIRFKSPQAGEVSFTDIVQGEVKVANGELDDMVLLRADGSPTYNFCAVVDDIDMGITYVLRGDDHLRNSLRQCNLYQALEVIPPQFAHLPMILNQQGARLSKREGADDLLNYRAKGILPDALCSYMARLGWASGDKELFTRTELLELFELSGIQKSPAGYDETKLLWMNNNFITQSTAEELLLLLNAWKPSPPPSPNIGLNINKAINLHKDRCDTINQLADEIGFYYNAPTSYNQEGYSKFINAESLTALSAFKDKLSDATEWEADVIKTLLKDTLAVHNLKFPQLAMPLRLAITGSTNSPPIDRVVEILGKDETLRRITALIDVGSSHDK